MTLKLNRDFFVTLFITVDQISMTDYLKNEYCIKEIKNRVMLLHGKNHHYKSLMVVIMKPKSIRYVHLNYEQPSSSPCHSFFYFVYIGHDILLATMKMFLEMLRTLTCSWSCI